MDRWLSMAEFAKGEGASLADVLRSWCDRNEITYRDRDGFLEAFWDGPCGQVRAILQAHDADELAMVFLYPPVRMPAAALPRMAEPVARVNWELSLWCVELGWDDGVVRLRASAISSEGHVEDHEIARLLFGGLDVMNHYLPAVYAVAFGGAAPADALAALPPPASSATNDLN